VKIAPIAPTSAAGGTRAENQPENGSRPESSFARPSRKNHLDPPPFVERRKWPRSSSVVPDFTPSPPSKNDVSLSLPYTFNISHLSMKRDGVLV
jgi:hypothetical protein